MQNALDALSNIGGVGGLVNVTQTQTFEVQTVTVTGGAGTFTLSFNGVPKGNIAFNASAATVQMDLNNLSTIGGVGGAVTVTLAAGVYTVTFGGALDGGESLLVAQGTGMPNPAVALKTQGSIVYTVTFAGILAGQNLTQMISNSPSVTVLTTDVGLDPKFAMYTGAIAMEPGNDEEIYLGTGETNTSSDSYYGTGIYRSLNGGITWSLITNDEIQGVLLQGGENGTADTYTVSFTGPNSSGTTVTDTSGNIAYGNGAAVDANALRTALNSATFTNISAVGGSVTVQPISLQEIQQFTVINPNTANSGTFEISFGLMTTGAINYNASAATVQGDLAGIGLSSTVTAWLNTDPAEGVGVCDHVHHLLHGRQRSLSATAGYPEQFHARGGRIGRAV